MQQCWDLSCYQLYAETEKSQNYIIFYEHDKLKSGKDASTLKIMLSSNLSDDRS